MSTKRLLWVDEARGFAMISVVVCHIANGFYRSQLFQEYAAVLYSIQKICNSFQMPLFCLVSGFLFGKLYITSSKNVNREKIKKQVINFMLLYLIWSIIFGIVKVCMGDSVNDAVTIVDMLLIPINPIGVYWWLYVLSFVYLIVAFIINKHVNINLFVSISFVFFAISSTLIDKSWTQWFEIRRIFYYLFIFVIGIEYQHIKNRKRFWWVALLLLLISIVTIITFWNDEREIYHIPFVNAVVALSAGIALLWSFEHIRLLRNNNIIQIIGKFSLEIFVLHVFITAGSRFIINKLPPSGAMIYFIIVCITTFLVPIGISKLTKRLGIYQYLFNPYNAINKGK